MDTDNNNYVCTYNEPYINTATNVKETKTVYSLFCIYRDNITLSIKDLSKRNDCKYTYNTLKKKSSLYEWTKRRELYYIDLRERETEESENLRTYYFNKEREKIDLWNKTTKEFLKYLLLMLKQNPNNVTKYANSYKQINDTRLTNLKCDLRLLGLPETIKEDTLNINNNVELEPLQDLIQAPEFIEENMKPFEIFKEKQLEAKKEHEQDKE